MTNVVNIFIVMTVVRPQRVFKLLSFVEVLFFTPKNIAIRDWIFKMMNVNESVWCRWRHACLVAGLVLGHTGRSFDARSMHPHTHSLLRIRIHFFHYFCNYPCRSWETELDRLVLFVILAAFTRFDILFLICFLYLARYSLLKTVHFFNTQALQ